MTVETKQILLLGTGFVAGPCLDYLAKQPGFYITVASRRIENAEKLAQGHSNVKGSSVDVFDDDSLEKAIACHDLVISLIPYTHHARVMKAAIKFKKHVVTTSYVSPAMQELDQAAKEAGKPIPYNHRNHMFQ